MLQSSTRGHRRPKYIAANFKMSPPTISISTDRGKERKSHVYTFLQEPQSKPLCSERSTRVHCRAQLRKPPLRPVSQTHSRHSPGTRTAGREARPQDATRRQKGEGWKGPLGSTWSNCAAQAGLHRASCPGWWLDRF